MSCKGYFSGLFVVKRFNRPRGASGGSPCTPVAVATSAPTHAPPPDIY